MTSTKKKAIICAGLNCLDLQLIGCTKSGQEEAIEQYDQAVYCAGGSASMAATTLAQIDKSRIIHVLTKLGKDRNGELMLEFYKQAGAATDLCFMDESVATAMSVLPIFKADGGRGCFFNLASNNSFTKEEVIAQLENIDLKETQVDAFLFGYPHLMPKLQDENLKSMLENARQKLGQGVLIGVDLNGVSADNHHSGVLSPALKEVDVLHLNEEEAEILSGCKKEDLLHADDKLQLVCDKLHDNGCATVVLSMGSKGAYLSVSKDCERLTKCSTAIKDHFKPGTSVRVPAFAIESGNINANGAGDALFSGFCWAAATQDDLSLEQVGTFASLVARQRCDVATRDSPRQSTEGLLEAVRSGTLPPTL